MPDWQTTVALLIVLGAVVLLIRRALKIRSGAASGCFGCNKCETKSDLIQLSNTK